MTFLERKPRSVPKISATFLAFAEPSLRPMGWTPADPEGQTMLKVCWSTWNAVVLADFGGRTDLLEALLDPSRSSPGSVVLVQTLVERKRSRRFAKDNRLIGDYKVRCVDGDVRVWAEARGPCRKASP